MLRLKSVSFHLATNTATIRLQNYRRLRQQDLYDPLPEKIEATKFHQQINNFYQIIVL